MLRLDRQYEAPWLTKHNADRNISTDMLRKTYQSILRFVAWVRATAQPGDDQHHVAGVKTFVDYSGKRIAIVDPTTGEIHEA